MVLNLLKASSPACFSLDLPKLSYTKLYSSTFDNLSLCFRYQINLVLVQNDNANFHTTSEQCFLYFKSLCCKNFRFCVVLIEVHFLFHSC